ncbi:PAS domain-containing protein, partial [Candidatus Fermentibacterales bacterium]|nr:PAS domain-containing protein [Candidatus Fermentibacterales bacterium]
MLFVSNYEDPVILEANELACGLLGRGDSPLEGSRLLDLACDESARRDLVSLLECLRSGEDCVRPLVSLAGRSGVPITAIASGLRLSTNGHEGDLMLSLSDVTHLVGSSVSDGRARSLENVFDAIQDGISVLDDELNIVRVNHWMKRMYESDRPIEGRKCFEVYQRRKSPCPWCPTLGAMKTGERRSTVVPYPTEQEPTGWIELSAFPLADSSGRRVGVIEYVKDITPQRLAENELRSRLDELQSLERIGRETASSLSLDRIGRVATEEAARATSSDLAMFFVLHEGGLVLRAAWPEGSLSQIQGVGHLREGECLCGLAAIGAEPVYSMDMTSDSRATSGLCGEMGIASVAALPLISEGEVLGVLAVCQWSRRDYTEVSAFLETLAMQVALALRNSLLYENLRGRAADLSERVAERTEELERRTKELEEANRELEAFSYSVS